MVTAFGAGAAKSDLSTFADSKDFTNCPNEGIAFMKTWHLGKCFEDGMMTAASKGKKNPKPEEEENELHTISFSSHACRCI